MRNVYENVPSNQIEKQKRYLYGALINILYRLRRITYGRRLFHFLKKKLSVDLNTNLVDGLISRMSILNGGIKMLIVEICILLFHTLI